MELQDHSKEELEENVPFFPNVLLAEMSLAIAVIGFLAIFVALFPIGLGEKFDPIHPPTILEPEWYFMGVYQFLKTQGVEPIYGVFLIAGLGIFLVATPFIDRGSERRPLRRPLFVAVAFFAATEFLGLTIYGYLSPGQVGSFSSTGFATAFLVTNLTAILLISVVLLANRRITRSIRK
jgi:quinol-cytochrome oxidoreductase complex cytochrome b subunit